MLTPRRQPWLQPHSRHRRCILLVAVALLLGCEPGFQPRPALENYQYRLSNVFQFTEAVPAPVTPVQYPNRRQLLRVAPPLSINLLDFLRLSSCDLQRLLGERNSSLGKLMADSQRWHYDLEFIRLARLCVAQLEPSALRDTLRHAVAQKIDFLPSAHWNLTWASPEMQHFFSASTAVQGDLLIIARAQVAALRRLDVLVSAQLAQLSAQDPGSPAAAEPELEPLLAQIASANSAGALARDMALAMTWLEPLTAQISAAARANPLCPQGRATERARVMHTVFSLFYIGEIQPWLSAVDRRLQLLTPVLLAAQQQAEQLAGGSGYAFNHYWRRVWRLAAPDSLAARFRRAVMDHTREWQQQLGACGLRPGQ